LKSSTYYDEEELFIEKLAEAIEEAREFFDEDDIECFLKTGKISTPAQKAKQREYRTAHKAQIARKAKKRARMTRQGSHRKRKRIGTAAGGFTFVEVTSGVGPKHSKSSAPQKISNTPSYSSREPKHLNLHVPSIHSSSTRAPTHFKFGSAQISNLQGLIAFFSKHSKAMYDAVRPRAIVPKKMLSFQTIESMGFEPTYLAVPEPGQQNMKSWRGPLGFHIHDHGDWWVVHQDHVNPKAGIIQTVNHTVTEGIPATATYLKAVWKGVNDPFGLKTQAKGALKNKLKPYVGDRASDNMVEGAHGALVGARFGGPLGAAAGAGFKVTMTERNRK
jgi:hypothetical protein